MELNCGRSHRKYEKKDNPKEQKTMEKVLKKFDIECRQLTRSEKYEFFLAIRDEPEHKMVSYIKDNPWTLSSIFWFEIVPKRNIFGKEENGCSCSEDCELGMKPNVSSDEMMSKLEMCIRFGMCPHVLLQKCGITVSHEQDISVDEMSKHYPEIQNLNLDNPVRTSSKDTAGIYWIHLAILFGKEIIIQDILRLYCHSELPVEFLLSLKHKISPVLYAVAHNRMPIAKCIVTICPSLLYYEAVNLNLDGSADILPNSASINALVWALANQLYENFIELWNMDFEAPKRTMYDVSSLWYTAMENVIITRNEELIGVLAKVKRMSIDNYLKLFPLIKRSGYNSAYQIILEESDFCDQFMRDKKTTKSETNMKDYRTQLILDKIMAFIVLDGDASVVKLFIDYGFNADIKLFNLSLLAWAGCLNLTETEKVLSSVVGIKKDVDVEKPIIDNILDFDTWNDKPFTDTDRVYVINKLFEHGHLIITDKALDKACDKNQYRVVKYLLLRGADPYSIFDHHYWIWKLMYLIITTNTPFVKFHDFLKEKGSFHYLYSRFDILQVLPEVVGKSGIQDMVSVETMNWLTNNAIPIVPSYVTIQWHNHVRSLQSICRSTLCSHFKGYKYLRYLKLIEKSIPLSILMYLKKEDLLQKFLSKSQREEYDELFDGVDTYFL